jgi:hypothetical protein
VQNRPKARTEGVLAERVDDELVVYDQTSQVGHCLSATAAAVWERCDGRLSPGEIAGTLSLEPAVVERAVDELRGCGLMDDGPALEGGYSRREAAVKFARVGGAALMAPLIYSVAIPQAAAAASACIATGSAETLCTAASGSTATDARCCSGQCYDGSPGKICVSATCTQLNNICLLNSNCCSNKCTLGFCKV